MDITGLFEDLDRLKEDLLNSKNKVEEWQTRCRIQACLYAIYFTKVGDIECSYLD